MPGCVLHVVGDKFDPSTVLARSSLGPYLVFQKGDKRFPGNPTSSKLHDTCGFRCEVAAGGNLHDQALEATAFLENHFDALLELCSVPEIESKSLDFGYECRLDDRGCCVQQDDLPPEILRLCGSLGIWIKLSLYPRLKD